MRRAVHTHYGDELLTAWRWESPTGRGSAAGGGGLPGPTPVFFFAPDRVVKRSRDWGRAGLETNVADAWHPFCDWIGGWLQVVHGQGFEAVRSAYLDVLEGRVDPRTAHVVSLV